MSWSAGLAVIARAGHHWHTLSRARPSPVITSNDTCASHARLVVCAHMCSRPGVRSENTMSPPVFTLSGTVSSRKASSRLPKSMLTSTHTGRGGSASRNVGRVTAGSRKSNTGSNYPRPTLGEQLRIRPAGDRIANPLLGG